MSWMSFIRTVTIDSVKIHNLLIGGLGKKKQGVDGMFLGVRLCLSLILLGMSLAVFHPSVEASPFVSGRIYQWVQSTARADYYFNKEQICFAVCEDGTININAVLVPTLKVYDAVQIEDVIAKRRWKMLPVDDFDNLAGATDYLWLDLAERTVTVTQHDELDAGWNSLSEEEGGEPIKLSDYAEKDVDGIFYRAIFDYALQNTDKLLSHTDGTLKDEDKKKLEERKEQYQEKEEPLLKLDK